MSRTSQSPIDTRKEPTLSYVLAAGVRARAAEPTDASPDSEQEHHVRLGAQIRRLGRGAARIGARADPCEAYVEALAEAHHPEVAD